MVKNIDEKENSFQDELQEDVLDSNNNPSGIYLLWQKLTRQKIAICKFENVYYWLCDSFAIWTFLSKVNLLALTKYKR